MEEGDELWMEEMKSEHERDPIMTIFVLKLQLEENKSLEGRAAMVVVVS